jgi:hypothetical protein
MKVAVRLLLFAFLVALGVWLWTILFPAPEKVIRQRLAKLARTVSFSGNEGRVLRLAGAGNLAGFFSTNIEINIDVPGRVHHSFMGRDEITQAALAARSGSGSLSVKFPDIRVTVAADRQSAVADLTLEATIPGEPDPIVQEMKFTLQKTDGEWLITRIESVRTFTILDFALPHLPFIVSG